MKAQQERDYVAYVTGRLPALRRIAAQLAGDPHRGDDLVQQAITKLYLQWRRAGQAQNLDAYAYKVLVRVFLDERRLGWANVRLGGTPTDVADRPVAEVESRLLLRDALGRLPPRQRAVVVLRYLADRSVDEVALVLQISTGTVKSQSSHGLATLRRLLAEQSDDATNKLDPGVLT